MGVVDVMWRVVGEGGMQFGHKLRLSNQLFRVLSLLDMLLVA